MKTPYFYFLLLMLLSACSENPSFRMIEKMPATEQADLTYHEEVPQKGMPASKMSAAQPGSAPTTPITEPKIIKNAHLRFKVSNLQSSTQSVQTIVKKYEGYITSSTESRSDREVVNAITIRVENTRFDALLNELSSAAVQVDYKNIYTQDVTEEYIDIEARLRNRKQLEQRYLELLRQARTVEDIIRIEAQLAQVREQIESEEGRLKYLNDRILHSTIQLEMYETIPFTTEPVVFFHDFVNAFSTGWKILLNFIVGLAALWPFIILLIALFWWIRHRRRKKARAAGERLKGA